MATATNPIAVLKTPITIEQWGKLDGETRYDLVNGQLKERPDAAFWHEILLGHLFAMLYDHIADHDLGLLVSSKAKLKISKFGGREPDIFFVPKSLFHLVGKNLFKGVPPLAIEILSPTNANEDGVDKRREYAGLGIGHTGSSISRTDASKSTNCAAIRTEQEITNSWTRRRATTYSGPRCFPVWRSRLRRSGRRSSKIARTNEIIGVNTTIHMRNW